MLVQGMPGPERLACKLSYRSHNFELQLTSGHALKPSKERGFAVAIYAALSSEAAMPWCDSGWPAFRFEGTWFAPRRGCLETRGTRRDLAWKQSAWLLCLLSSSSLRVRVLKVATGLGSHARVCVIPTGSSLRDSTGSRFVCVYAGKTQWWYGGHRRARAWECSSETSMEPLEAALFDLSMAQDATRPALGNLRATGHGQPMCEQRLRVLVRRHGGYSLANILARARDLECVQWRILLLAARIDLSPIRSPSSIPGRLCRSRLF